MSKKLTGRILFIFLIALSAVGCELVGIEPTQPCAWTWAYGEGSPAMEEKVKQEFEAAAIDGTVRTKTYGENYCDGFHPAGLEVSLEVRVADFDDTESIRQLASSIQSILERHWDDWDSPDMEYVRLKFTNADGTRACFWNFETEECKEI